MSKHFDTVQSIYAAFGRGDVPAMLATLADNVDWDYEAGSTDIPWIAHRRGAADAAGFFEAVGKELDIKQFGVNAIVGNGDLVIALVTIEAVVRRTGRSFREVDEAHIWRFDGSGKVSKFRHCVDTHKQWLAWKQ